MQYILIFSFVFYLFIPAQTAYSQSISGGFGGGSVAIGYDNRTCNASLEGNIRYNSSSKNMEYCDGSSWASPGSGSAGTALPSSENPCFGNGSGTCIFISTGLYDGDLGGLSGADSTCASDATTGGLTGTYKAVLSTSTTNAKDRFTITYPIVTPNGLKVEETDLWSGTREFAAIYDHNGEASGYSTGPLAWTGSLSSGNKGTDHCTNWTSASGAVDGNVGDIFEVDGEWMHNSSGFSPASCDGFSDLICMLDTGL